MEGKPVVVPIDADILTNDDKKKALDAVNLIEEKRDGRIKLRTCANGSKQRQYSKEYESVASPTVGLESLMTALLIGAHEGRKFISFDVPGAFLQAEMAEDKLVLLKLRRQFVDMMCEINPEFKPHVRCETTKNGKKFKVLYMKVIRAIYGCIKAALQWYIIFTGTLKKLGYKLNPYDKCVANKVINGNQCTMAWHVNDAIASHDEQKVFDELGEQMKFRFGEMNITTGTKHSFLGMKINIDEENRTVEIEMKDQINKLIAKFEEDSGEDIKKKVSTPATHNLFKVEITTEELETKRSDIFHSTTASLLYIMKRARPDIETSVSYLMRRVSKSDNDDWLKLKRVLSFLHVTKDDTRKIGASSLTNIHGLTQHMLFMTT